MVARYQKLVFFLSKQSFWPFTFLPKYRNAIRFWLFSLLYLYVLLILQNGISEYFFWNEFGVRYNFIAVNYLIYTNEVIGNIMESYPVIPLFSALFALAGFITYFIVQNQNYIENIPSYIQKLKYQESIFCFLHCLPYLIYQRKTAKCICR
jgi:hypothetical protein